MKCGHVQIEKLVTAKRSENVSRGRVFDLEEQLAGVQWITGGFCQWKPTLKHLILRFIV